MDKKQYDAIVDILGNAERDDLISALEQDRFIKFKKRKKLYVFMDYRTGRLLGQYPDDEGGLYALFDMPEEHNSMGRLTYSTTIKRAKEWLKWFLSEADPKIMHFALHDDLINETAVLGIAQYEIKKFVTNPPASAVGEEE